MKTLYTLLCSLVLTASAHAAYLDFNFNGSAYMDADPTRALLPVGGYPRFDADLALNTTVADQDPAPDRGYYTNVGSFHAWLAGPNPGTGVGSIAGAGGIEALRVVQFADYNEVTMTGSMRDMGHYPNAPFAQDAFTVTLHTTREDSNTVPSLGHVLSGTYQIHWTNVFRSVAFHGDITTPLVPVPLPPAVLMFGAGILVLLGMRMRSRMMSLA